MNSAQIFGILVFCLGIVLFIVGTVSVFFAGKAFMPVLFAAGTLLLFLGMAIILFFLVFERIKDMKKDKEMFSKMEGRK